MHVAQVFPELVSDDVAAALDQTSGPSSRFQVQVAMQPADTAAPVPAGAVHGDAARTAHGCTANADDDQKVARCGPEAVAVVAVRWASAPRTAPRQRLRRAGVAGVSYMSEEDAAGLELTKGRSGC